MVYRSSRRPPAGEEEAENLQDNLSFDSNDSDKESKVFQRAATWRLVSIVLACLCVLFLIVIIVQASSSASSDDTPLCGTGSKSMKSKRVMDFSVPDKPGPFYDLTKKEIKNILSFLRKDPTIKLKDFEDAKIKDVVLYMMDLYPAKKAEVQAFLAGKRSQPERLARVILFRRDLDPPMVHELICGPLPHVKRCPLLKSNARRNPIEYSLRPIVYPPDTEDMIRYLFPQVDRQIGYILRESYGTSFANCKPGECLKFYPSPIATNVLGDVNLRKMWLSAHYDIEYYGQQVLDFGMLANLDSLDPEKHYISKIWYHGQSFDTVDDFIRQYNQSRIQKTRIRPTSMDPRDSFASLYRRGDPVPEEPQRPPTLVEPDGKRYSVKHNEVEYLGWEFNFRMSPLSGPAINNIRYRGEGIAYEISLSDLGVTYSAYNPVQQICDYDDSGALMGMMSRSLIPGADCPSTATFISTTFASQTSSEPNEYKRGFCIFENNNGYPLRRHLSWSQFEGAFYGGMLDSALIVRSILTVVNYDYVVDFIFHQSGAVQTRIISTGYILGGFYSPNEKPYGWEIHKNYMGPLHHHVFHFKVDLDISGTSNRYETLDIKPDQILLKEPLNQVYHQNRFERSLKKTEKEALFKFDFEKPKYHIVHNEAKKTDLGQPKAYRIHMNGMSKQLLPEDRDNEITFSWARHQLVVTKQKDEEILSGSPYGMFDSINPVTNFTKFYNDDENIVDKDLVFWISSGIYHIPHTEDLPITPAIGGQAEFYLLPYNYFPYCPSFNSRDHISLHLKDNADPMKGVKIDRHGYRDDQCKTPKYATIYDELLNKEPDIVFDME